MSTLFHPHNTLVEVSGTAPESITPILYKVYYHSLNDGAIITYKKYFATLFFRNLLIVFIKKTFKLFLIIIKKYRKYDFTMWNSRIAKRGKINII